MEYMIIDWNATNNPDTEYFAKSLWEIFEKEKKKGFNKTCGDFLKIVRKHNLTDKSFSSVTDKDILYEFDIITVPELAKATQIKDVKIKKNNRKGFREDIINGYYIFSKNYGWIDRGHAGFLGGSQHILKFYKQLLLAKKDDVLLFEMSSGIKKSIGGIDIDVKINNASTKIRILADRITEDDAKSITLAVLKDTSKEFEQVQKRTDFIKNSSFAEEDLPSNILNFYFEVENFSEQKIERLCNCLSVEQSCWIADRYNFSRNQTFDPKIIFPGGVKPIEFNSITEAKAGVLWEKI